MTPTPTIDSLSSPSPAPRSAEPAPNEVQRAKTLLISLAVLLYFVYVLWCVALLVLLPPTNGGMESLIKAGTMSGIMGAVVFALIGLGGLLRVRSNASLPQNAKMRGLIRAVSFSAPGLLLSIAVPVLINREPALILEVASPTNTDLIAPIAVTYSAEKAAAILLSRGTRILQYKWDVDGDGKIDRETVVPTLQTTYQREGSYATTVTMVPTSGASRKLSRRMIIQKAVFTVDPVQPIVNQPATFDAQNLVQSAADIQMISWDFDNDGKMDVEGKEAQATTTFYQKGSYTVSVTVQLTNKTQTTYQRTIDIVDAPPLPFPIAIVTKPGKLISAAPFTVIFSVKTDEQLAQVQWNFGDGTRSEGIADIPHTFAKKGNYVVVARARSATGTVANVTIPVLVADQLQLNDLTFKGSPQPQADVISGEIPLTVSLDPQTNAQFVTFTWEAPEATEVGSTDGQLQAIYRTAGTYKVTLIAQDAAQKVLRKQFTVQAKPISSYVSFQMDPKDGVSPLKVRFDASESDIPGATITGFEWDFGDGSEKQFGGAQTDHEFELPGTYQVQLRVRTTSGSNETTATQTIVVREPPLQACLLVSRSRVSLSNPYVSFDSSCTTGETASIAWDFGDGSQSSDAKPIHQFTQKGTFTVRLTVTDGTGRKSTKSATISVE